MIVDSDFLSYLKNVYGRIEMMQLQRGEPNYQGPDMYQAIEAVVLQEHPDQVVALMAFWKKNFSAIVK